MRLTRLGKVSIISEYYFIRFPLSRYVSHDSSSGRGEREVKCGVRGCVSPSLQFPLLLVLSVLTIIQHFKMAPKKPAATAEVALTPLKNCLVNLPPSLVALLVNANTVSLLVVLLPWIIPG